MRLIVFDLEMRGRMRMIEDERRMEEVLPIDERLCLCLMRDGTRKWDWVGWIRKDLLLHER